MRPGLISTYRGVGCDPPCIEMLCMQTRIVVSRVFYIYMYIYICICICICMDLYVYIYVYIYM
jgi:hypothetical protein